MNKKYRNKNRTMKGGFFDKISSTLSGWSSSISQGASNAWNKTKNAIYRPSNTTSTYSTSNYSSYGGKKRRYIKGGFTDNTPTSGLASHAAPFSGLTAGPKTIVGGRKNKIGSKTRKYYKK